MISITNTQRLNQISPSKYKANHRRSITETSRNQKMQQNQKIVRKHKRLQSYKEYHNKFSKNFSDQNNKFANIYIRNAVKKQQSIKGSKIHKLILSDNVNTFQLQRQNDDIEKVVKKSCLMKKIRSRTNTQSAKVNFIDKGKTEHIMKQTLDNFLNKNNQKQQITKLQKSSVIDLQAWKLQVSKICNSLQQLKKFGSVQKKIHKWCTNYFQSKKRGLIDLFMRKVYKKKSLSNQINYFAIMEEEILLSKIIESIEQMSDKQKYFLGIQIALYRTFLEEKIASKHKLQLDQIQDRVKSNIETAPMKGFARQLYQTINTSPQVIGFFADLQRIEETYGRLNLLSLKNRKRFQNINESQIHIKKLIHN